jgi:hypothetical protein
MTAEHGAVSHQQRDTIRFKLACLHFVVGERRRDPRRPARPRTGRSDDAIGPTAELTPAVRLAANLGRLLKGAAPNTEGTGETPRRKPMATTGHDQPLHRSRLYEVGIIMVSRRSGGWRGVEMGW